MSETILITGAMGYVGGRIAQHLAGQTDHPLRLAARRPPAARPAWVPRGEFVALDVTNQDQCDAACRGVGAVIHLAALNENDCAADPIAAALVNGVGTWRMVQAALRGGVGRFIFFSTSRVYGDPLAGTVTEETVPRPTHPYASSHLFGESAVLEAHDKRKLVGVAVRLSNGLGAPAHPDVNRWTLLGNDLCRQAARGRKLTLRSSGLALRDFIPLGDVCAAVRHLLDLERAACGDGVFNLGSGHAMRVLDVAELVAQRCAALFGGTVPIERPVPAAGETVLPLDFRIDKLRQTGFLPAGRLEEEIDASLRLCAVQSSASG